MPNPDDRKQAAGKLEDYRPGRKVTREEIQQVLQDDGYSSSARQAWLKSLLTDLSQDEGEGDPVDPELINDVERGIDRLQPRESQAESDS